MATFKQWLIKQKPANFSGWLNLAINLCGTVTLLALAIAAFLKDKDQENAAIIAFWAFLATAIFYTLDYFIFGRKDS